MKHHLFTVALTLSFFAVGTASAQTASEHFKRAQEAYGSGNFSLAVTEYTSSVSLDPKNYSAYHNRALAHQKNGSLDLSILDFTKAIELKPDYLAAYVNRGNVHGRRGALEFALADYSKAIELDPRNANAYFNRGSTYKNKGNLAEALADYNKALELDPKYAKALNMRGNVHSQNRNWDFAIADWDRAVELEPSLSFLHYQNLWTHMIVNDNERAHASAVKYLDAVGMKENQSGWGLIGGYLALLRSGKQKEAEAFISRYPHEQAPGVFPVRVLAFLRGSLTEAELLAAAADDKMKLMAARTYIGEMQLLNGKTAAALENFKLAKQNGPKNTTEFPLAVSQLERHSAK